MYSEINGRIIENVGDKNIYLVSDFRYQDIKNVVICDALILDYTDSEGCVEFLRSIRSSLIESIYLVPVFIYTQGNFVSDIIKNLNDGIIQNIEEQKLLEKINSITSRREMLKIVEATTPEIRILNKILRYLFTRNSKLEPVVNPQSHIGYEYTLISRHFLKEHSLEMLQFLNQLTEKELLKRNFVDKVQLCNKCYSGFLNHRSICPKCSSINLSMQTLILHKSCGYLGLEKAFGDQGNMICPNCEMTLKKSGLDYTDTQRTYSCDNCKHIFRENNKSVFCFNCKSEFKDSELVSTNIYSYDSTEKAKKYICMGEIKKESETEKTEPNISGFVSFSTFSTFLEYEIQRAKSTNSIVSIGKIKIDISYNDKSRLGLRFVNLIEEIGEFIKNTSTSGDIISLGPNDVFIIVSPFSTLTKLDFLLGNMQVAVQKMLSIAFPDFDINVRVKSNFVDGRTEKNDLINDLIR